MKTEITRMFQIKILLLELIEELPEGIIVEKWLVYIVHI